MEVTVISKEREVLNRFNTSSLQRSTMFVNIPAGLFPVVRVKYFYNLQGELERLLITVHKERGISYN